MPSDRLPASVIQTASNLLTYQFFSHQRINNLFLRCGAMEPIPDGNLHEKIATWLRDSPFAYHLLGCVIEDFMEIQTDDAEWIRRS